MISRDEIIKLAALSRLKLSEDEISRMQGDMTSILAYVDKLKAAEGAEFGPVMSVNRNVMREDANPHESGTFTDALIALSPKHQATEEGKFVKVKKILGSSQ
ncbi:MAG TPA: Asp-tRNA(Asn)/Glu-tRNA(Gln) amidotransferase subunit GatC [Candidatus Paceibacterota bacterium]|nr:Asp-tRNA(Asn)/Glu-tRNA(Gln) amidotransferase subunit GatC [Candidatus Paceibacterota bacterium]